MNGRLFFPLELLRRGQASKDAGETALALPTMVVYSFFIFDRHGKCIDLP